jgi:hypothetical protein
MNKLALMPLIIFSLLAAETRIRHHDLLLTLDPATHEIFAVDIFQASFRGKLDFKLGADFLISDLRVNGKSRKVKAITTAQNEHEQNIVTYQVSLPFWRKGEAEVLVEYTGKRFEDTGRASFSREKIAMSITATISEEGVFLSPSSGFYPSGDENLSLFNSAIHLPGGWDAVSEGKRILASKDEHRSVLQYETEHPVDGIYVTAAQWIVDARTVDGIEFYTFFFPEDTTLAHQYMDMSIQYARMYSSMISPYPFSKFAVVENFFPTGYGMPSYTVLGRTVVRLPFIVHTSLGHEVLHNWWGNSVYIGEGGNWCEGLTTYQADYLYKLKSDEAAARQYRKDILKDYTIYASEEKDFPPAEFTRRSDMSTRSVGYGKVAMIFHMVEEYIGHENFIRALQEVITQQQWTETSYDDFFRAFERSSGESFSAFNTAWIHEPGAPLLELIPKGSSFAIRQTGTVKPIWIPVRLTGASGAQIQLVIYSADSLVSIVPSVIDGFEDDELVELAVDPDYHLMRRLHDTELDATLRNILSESEFAIVVPEKSAEWHALARTFREAITEDTTVVLYGQNESLDPGAIIYLGTIPTEQELEVQQNAFEINGVEFDSRENALVWAYTQDNGYPGLIIYSSNLDEMLPLAGKLPHYGKYGYLVFNNGRNVAKGNHEAKGSLLIWENIP